MGMAKPILANELYTVKEAGERLNLSRTAIFKMRKSGALIN